MKDENKTKAQLIEELVELRERMGELETVGPKGDAAEITAKRATGVDYLQVFDSIPLPATLIDAQSVVVNVNQAFLGMAHSYGIHIRKEDRIGGHISSFSVSEEERTRFKVFTDELFRTGKEQHRLWSGKDSLGQERFWDIHASVIRDTVGEMTGALILREDITERKWQEAQQTALHRVRDEIWKMSTSKDIKSVLVAVRESLMALNIPFSNCGINIGDWRSDTLTFHSHNMTMVGEWFVQTDPHETEVLRRIGEGGEVAYRRDLNTKDVYGERERIAADWGERIRSVVDIPFSHGTLAVNSTEPNAFSQEDIELLQEMAQVLSEGFTRMEDLQSLEQRNQELEEKERLLTAFHQMGQIILSSLDREQILDNLATQVIQANIFRSLMIALVDEETRTVEVVRSYHCITTEGAITPGRSIERGKDIEGLTHSLEDENDLTVRTIRSGELLVCEGWERNLTQEPESPDDQNKVAYFIPIKKQDTVLGVLATASRREEKEEMLVKIDAMEPLVDQVAIALEQAQLHNAVQSYIREVEGTNRQLQQEIVQHQQTEEALRESEKNFRDLVENLLDGVAIADENTHHIYVNPK